MTTASGDISVDFKGLGASNPYLATNFNKPSASDTDSMQIVVPVATGLLKPNGFSTMVRWRRTDAWSGSATLRAKVEVGAIANGDVISAIIADSTGHCYALVLFETGLTSASIKEYSAAGSQLNFISSCTLGAAAVGDVFTLELVQSTHTLNVYQNGSLVTTNGISGVTDTAITSGLAPGLMGWFLNSNGSAIASWAGDGSSAGATVNPSAASLAFTGQTPTITKTNNVTLSPSAASLTFSGNTPTVSLTGSQSVSPTAASIAFTGQSPTITAESFTWYSLPAPGGYDSNSILVGQTYPTGSFLRVVTDFAHITANYATGPLQNDINDYSTAAGGYTGSDTATYEIKAGDNGTTSQYIITAIIQQGAISLGPTPAALAFTGATPTISLGANTTVTPSAAVLTFTGNTPTITATNNQSVAPSSASMTLSVFTPILYINGVPIGGGGVVRERFGDSSSVIGRRNTKRFND